MLAPRKALHADRWRLLCAAGALACVAAGFVQAARAQQRVRPGQTVAQPVVQALPNPDNLRLNSALSRLGRNPRDLDALIDAGGAALALGDVDAATGFFKRADQVSPGDPRVKAGLGGALVRSGNPLDAIALFAEAERSGAQLSLLAGDRGLAYDLVGDNATAQRLYRMALERAPSEEVTRRLALSLAISGDRRGTETVLLPLLREQSKPAWRARTFALAIMGQPDEAIRTARTILPGDLADSMAPYLRYMPQLTRAQQAAAANLGNFPRASEIGRDDPRFAQYVASGTRSPSLAASDARLVARGEPLGRSGRNERQAAQVAAQEKPPKVAVRAATAARTATRVAPPEPQPTREVAAPPRAPVPTQSMSAPIAASASPSVPQLAAIASPLPAQPAPPAPVPAKPAAPVIPPPTPAARPGFDLAQLPQSQTMTPPPPPAAVAPPPPVAAAPPPPAPSPARPPIRISLAEAFGDLGKPSTTATPAEGAVDITRIATAKPRPEAAKSATKAAPPKPAPPSHPSRIWVQLGVGRDKGALATDWKKLSKQAAVVFKGRRGYVSAMGQTNRLLAGPFDSAAQANKFMADLRGTGINGSYIWTSPAGQVVDTLPIR